jgi:hypothetical protein
MQPYIIEKKDNPILATALHDGHGIPLEAMEYMLLGETERFREEDPYTAEMADLPVNKIIVNTSRFYVDLNRPVEKALYLKAKDAWGLNVWDAAFPRAAQNDAISYYQRFYEDARKLIEGMIINFGYFVVLDIHSYNHRREGPEVMATREANPEINLGTFYNPIKWAPLLDQFGGYLAHCKIRGHYPDIRNNVIFKGGGFAQWVLKNYGEKGAVISVEFKKTFMDEWTGRGYPAHIDDIHNALHGSLPLLENELRKFQ